MRCSGFFVKQIKPPIWIAGTCGAGPGALLEVISDVHRCGERSADAYEAFESIIEAMEKRSE